MVAVIVVIAISVGGRGCGNEDAAADQRGKEFACQGRIHGRPHRKLMQGVALMLWMLGELAFGARQQSVSGLV
ncbi:hypothetical protein MASR2M16_03100 [Thauera terpenica]